MARSFVALVATLLVASPAAGVQQQTGTITGRVLTGDGAPIEGVVVTVRGLAARAHTDARGEFVLTGVPAGRWNVVTRRIGFRPATREVRVASGGSVRLELTLVAAPVSVDAVVVEALASEGERTHELADLLRVPPVGAANVTTVTSREIDAVHAADPWDLVRETTGLEIHEQGQGPGFASDAVVRGFTSDHSTDVALLVDGVPINEPINGHGEGYADWNLIFPGAIADIQVVKGPISPLFGNYAAGGTVNVITPAEADRTTLTVDGGSFMSGAATVTTGIRAGRWGGFLAGRLTGTEGWRENQGYRTGQVVARGNRRMNGGLVLDAAGHYYETSWDSPGYLSVPTFNRGALTGAADPTDGGFKRRVGGRLAALVTVGGLEWQTMAWGYRSRWELFLNIPELGGEGEGLGSQTEEQDVRHALGARSLARWTTGAWELRAGAEFQRHEAEYDLYGTTARVRDTVVSRFDADFTNLGGYLGVARTIGRLLRLEAALRGDVLRAHTLDRTSGIALPAATRSVLSPKLGTVVYLRSDWQLYGSVARGFRTAPNLIGEPALRPVSVWDFEVGSRWATPMVEVAASAFRLETRNERLFNPITLEVESDGESVREGIEVETALRPWTGLELHTHWTFNTRGTFFLPAEAAPAGAATVPSLRRTGAIAPHAAAVQHPDDLQGERVPGVADYVGRVGLSVLPSRRLAVHGWMTFTGPYVPLGEPEVETNAYGIVNLRTTVAVSPRLEVAVGVENLSGEKAAELRASGFINPAPPRALRVSVRTQF